jgi:hypothetical protein
MPDLDLLSVPAVAVLEGSRITQIREEGDDPRDVDWTVTHHGDRFCLVHEDATAVHIEWTGDDGREGDYVFGSPAAWVTVKRDVSKLGPVEGRSPALIDLYEEIAPARGDRATTEFPREQAAAPTDETAAALCAYCEFPIRKVWPVGWAHVGAACGFTAKPIPAPAADDAGVSA